MGVRVGGVSRERGGECAEVCWVLGSVSIYLLAHLIISSFICCSFIRSFIHTSTLSGYLPSTAQIKPGLVGGLRCIALRVALGVGGCCGYGVGVVDALWARRWVAAWWGR